MLRAIPRSIFSWGYSIYENEVEAARLTPAWASERGELNVGGTEYSLYRQGWLSGYFVIEGERGLLAQADKPSAFVRRFEITTYDHHELCLVAQSPMTRAFSVYERDIEIGRIYPDHCFTRKTTIELPGDMSLPVQAFLFWLVVLMWRRAKRNS
jgi:hypothetical protein